MDIIKKKYVRTRINVNQSEANFLTGSFGYNIIRPGQYIIGDDGIMYMAPDIDSRELSNLSDVLKKKWKAVYELYKEGHKATAGPDWAEHSKLLKYAMEHGETYQSHAIMDILAKIDRTKWIDILNKYIRLMEGDI